MAVVDRVRELVAPSWPMLISSSTTSNSTASSPDPGRADGGIDIDAIKTISKSEPSARRAVDPRSLHP